MSFISLDLGASGTRYMPDSGYIGTLPNNVVMLENGVVSSLSPDAPDPESCLEVQIEKTSGNTCEHFPANVLIGVIAQRHPSESIRPNAMELKHKQTINFITALVGAALGRIKYGANESNILYIAVPPRELVKARAEFNEKMVGGYKLTFPKYNNGTVVTLNITEVKCYEEAFMAITSFFFNTNGVPKPETKKYINGTVMSLDIGASTSDVGIVKNGRYLDKTGATYTVGGNMARDIVRQRISAEYSMDLSVEDAEKVVAEGRLQQGNTYIDVREIVIEAKQALADRLVSNMQSYFSINGIDIRTINAIVVSGGGSIQSQYVEDGEIVVTSDPMSAYVTQKLSKWSPGTEVVNYGEDPRFANIKGLFIRASLDELKRARDAQPAAQAQTVAVGQVQPVVQPVATAQPVEQSVDVASDIPLINAGEEVAVNREASSENTNIVVVDRTETSYANPSTDALTGAVTD